MMANTDGDDVCPQLSASLECVRNIWQALQTINVKINTIVALCDCHSNIANQSQSAHTCRELISKSKRLRAELDMTDGNLEPRLELIPSSAKAAPKRSAGSSSKRHVCWYDGCNGAFHSRANLLAHIAKHTGEKSFVCEWPGCGKKFPYQRSLDRHTEMVHQKTARFKCVWPSCEEAFVQKHQLDCHVTDAHTGQKLYRCEWPCCDFQTNYLHGFKTHKLTHSGEKTFICEWPACGKEFPYKRSLDRHVEVLHLKTARYRCEWPDCERTFITKSQLDCHMTNAHTGEKLYKCGETGCHFETNYLKHMKDHRLRHDPNYTPEKSTHFRSPVVRKDRVLDEDLINKKTGQPLRRRRRPKNHSCSWPHCEYTFESPNALSKHMRTHTGETPYRCDWPHCERFFRYKQTLKVHVEMVHLKLKQYKCDWPACDAAFVSQTQLHVHNSDIHVGVKKFKCDWPACEWIGTNHAQELRFHKLRRHEGVKIVRNAQQISSQRDKEKRHSCNWPQCGKQFMYKSMLNQHLRSHRNKSSHSKQPKRQLTDDKTFDSHVHNTHSRHKRDVDSNNNSIDECVSVDSKQTDNLHAIEGDLIISRLSLPNEVENEAQDLTYQSSVLWPHYRCQWPNCSYSHILQVNVDQHMLQHSCITGLSSPEALFSTTGDTILSYLPVVKSTTVDNIAKESNAIDINTVNNELPFPCLHVNCWRRFKTQKALNWHLRKIHSNAC